MMYSKTKHIPIKYHFLQEHVAKKEHPSWVCGHKRTSARHLYKTTSTGSLWTSLPKTWSYLYSKNELFLNAYLICLRCTWGSTIRGQFSQGEKPWMERYLCQWWQRERDLSDVEDRGMVLGGSDLSYAEDRGMVSEGAWVIWFQCCIRVLPSMPKGDIVD